MINEGGGYRFRFEFRSRHVSAGADRGPREPQLSTPKLPMHAREMGCACRFFASREIAYPVSHP